MSASNPLAWILETNRLIENNYKDWLRNLRIILNSEKISYVLDQKPLFLPNRPTTESRIAFKKWADDDKKVKCYILASMTNELQRQYENMQIAKAIIAYLQELYGEQSRTACY